MIWGLARIAATGRGNHASTMMRLLAVLGPSGSGKSTVVRELHRRGVVEVTPSWTTRPRRHDELDGSVEHRFVDDEEFTARQRAGYFLEVVQMFGLPYRYGLPAVEAPATGGAPAIMVRAPLMPMVARHFPGHVAYQIEDDYRRARERLDRRPGDLGTRLGGFEEECRLGREVAHRIFVNEGSIADLVDAVAGAVYRDFDGHRKEEPCREAR